MSLICRLFLPRGLSGLTRAVRWFLGAAFLTSGVAGGMGIEGQLRDASAVTRSLGSTGVTVLLTNMAHGQIVGMGSLQEDQFYITLPEGFEPPVTPAGICPGVRVQPSEPKTYMAESLMVYSPGRDEALLLTQADHPTEPTRRAGWMYSDRAATLRGRCTGLNTSYDLKLHPGWNAVMTVSEPGHFTVKNASPGLPYWTRGQPFSGARALFPVLRKLR